jgi:outer membrane lipopolysaccharide assembly protein LptE/RlpB
MYKLTLILILACTGCGYHTAGHTNNLPASLQSIDVPTFKNETSRFKVEQQVTAAVVRELLTRTRYNVRSNEKIGDADAVLRGTITGYNQGPVVRDPATGHASALLNVRVKITLIDQKTKKVLYDNAEFVYREQYEISGQGSTYFDESSAGVDRLSRSLAASLVSGILSGF